MLAAGTRQLPPVEGMLAAASKVAGTLSGSGRGRLEGGGALWGQAVQHRCLCHPRHPLAVC